MQNTQQAILRVLCDLNLEGPIECVNYLFPVWVQLRAPPYQVYQTPAVPATPSTSGIRLHPHASQLDRCVLYPQNNV